MSDPLHAPASTSDDLSPAHVGAALHTRRLGRPYHLVATCASTNDEAAAHARRDQPEGLAVAADTQTGGRGRLGRSWHSPPGTNLYLSALLRPEGPPWALPPLTLLAGAVAAGVLRAAGAQPTLKWPNDILLPTADGPRKVAGILTEMASDKQRIRHVILGIGINVNGTEFPPDLQGRATSLRTVLGRPLDRGALLAAFLNDLEPAYDQMLRDGPSVALKLWRPMAALGGRCRIERDGGALDGVALDVDTDGALMVRDDTGKIHRVVSGEIT